nr:MAG TPA: TRYPTOPHAN RNA-BINDING ATTENUATOR PROTEIN-INHIBITORY PROTEIN REGULATION, ANTI-TRAP [Caudoviricetes sp.]
MSKERRIIEITPGRMSPGGWMREAIESKDFKCTYCQGNGYHWKEDAMQEPYKKECPICNGSGRLDAVIRIEWKPSKNKIAK